MHIQQLAELAYEAYLQIIQASASMAMPHWDALPAKYRQGWIAAAQALRAEMDKGKEAAHD